MAFFKAVTFSTNDEGFWQMTVTHMSSDGTQVAVTGEVFASCEHDMRDTLTNALLILDGKDPVDS